MSSIDHNWFPRSAPPSKPEKLEFQAFGTLAIVDLDEDIVVAASTAADPSPAWAPRTLQPGQRIKDLFGRSARQMLALRHPLDVAPACLGRFTFRSGEELLLLAQQIDEARVILEALPASGAEPAEVALSDVRQVEERLAAAGDAQALLEVAAQEVRRLTDFDRVLIHRLLPDGGEVILAEAGSGRLPPMRGHRRSAGSISGALRAKLEAHGCRFIPDVNYTPRLLVGSQIESPSLPDLERCLLQGVPSLCLDSLRGAGVRASLSLSILLDGELWGLINCHHSEAVAPNYVLLEKCDRLTAMLGTQLSRHERQQIEKENLRVQAASDAFLKKIAEHDLAEATLLAADFDLLNLFPADGVAIVCDHKIACAGTTPERADVRRLANCLGSLLTPRDGLFVTDHLAAHFPRAASYAELASGLLAIQVSSEPTTMILWFRREEVQTLQWRGPNPQACYLAGPVANPPDVEEPLLFGRVKGRSRAWGTSLVRQASLLQERASFVFQQRHIEALNKQLRAANRQLAQLAETDPLTGLANRRIFDERLLEEWSRAQRDGRPLSLILIDIDFFKRYNDHYGHPAGDSCLTTIAGVLKDAARRSSDLAARIGGEEFALFLPGASREGAEMIAEKLRRDIQNLGLEHARSPIGQVTITLGVASTRPYCSSAETRSHLVKTADAALYEAKEAGRNRVSVREM